MTPINIVSYNIHKGMSPLNRRPILHELARSLSALPIDVLCLQEVQGKNLKRELAFNEYPNHPQHEWFGEYLSLSSSYGANVYYPHGNHGNATLSRHRLDPKHNVNITVSHLEKRGVLHSEIYPADWGVPVVVLNAHLNLFEKDRTKQYTAIKDYINSDIDKDKPLILAGDFNDWTKNSYEVMADLGLKEVFFDKYGQYPKTFPAKFPLLSLDRIYVRHLSVLSAQVYKGMAWADLSDHLPIGARVVLDNSYKKIP
ncbi:endonuclease/exonuclease/phosphatase family protein [Moraxella oblonga]|uniref:endonuclease/exonuclease/phosphatase family protein n=1 Tax=Moraxella oblonga TaxID=200413 RepID=UPI0008367C50|nr:endonuclease/exonuclease/phosphatase family protein [Moraxella oblonga]